MKNGRKRNSQIKKAIKEYEAAKAKWGAQLTHIGEIGRIVVEDIEKQLIKWNMEEEIKAIKPDIDASNGFEKSTQINEVWTGIRKIEQLNNIEIEKQLRNLRLHFFEAVNQIDLKEVGQVSGLGDYSIYMRTQILKQNTKELASSLSNQQMDLTQASELDSKLKQCEKEVELLL